jgi:hypothetical protein
MTVGNITFGPTMGPSFTSTVRPDPLQYLVDAALHVVGKRVTLKLMPNGVMIERIGVSPVIVRWLDIHRSRINPIIAQIDRSHT